MSEKTAKRIKERKIYFQEILFPTSVQIGGSLSRGQSNTSNEHLVPKTTSHHSCIPVSASETQKEMRRTLSVQ